MKQRIINGHVFNGGSFTESTVITDSGKIEDILPPGQPSVSNIPVLYDAAGGLVLPGFIDVHVHFNEPGRTEWEGFRTGSAAAAAGGITTVFDMPLNSHPSAATAEALEMKKQALQRQSYIHYGLWGGITGKNAHNKDILSAMLDSGITGFKGFLSDSGIDDFKRLDRQSLRIAASFCAETNSVLALHAECEETLKQFAGSEESTWKSFLSSRPVEAELKAVELALEAALQYNTKLHIVHVSHPRVVELIVKARKTGADVTIETCPHYLIFSEADFLREGPVLKCAPPLRSLDSVEGLWEHIKNGHIDIVSSDHSPCPPQMKERGKDDIRQAWGGIQSIQFSPQAFLSEALKRGFLLEEALPLITSNPADRFQALSRQGRIQRGLEANVIVYHPGAETYVKKDDILFRHNYSPYTGRTLNGDITATIVEGEIVYKADEGVTGSPAGREITV